MGNSYFLLINENGKSFALFKKKGCICSLRGAAPGTVFGFAYHAPPQLDVLKCFPKKKNFMCLIDANAAAGRQDLVLSASLDVQRLCFFPSFYLEKIPV